MPIFNVFVMVLKCRAKNRYDALSFFKTNLQVKVQRDQEKWRKVYKLLLNPTEVVLELDVTEVDEEAIHSGTTYIWLGELKGEEHSVQEGSL
jgi:hypothetical protein